MIFLLELLVIFISLLIIAAMVRLARKLIPEFDIWWRRSNRIDPQVSQLEDLKAEELLALEKEKLANKLNPKEYRQRVERINKTFKQRRV